MDLQTLFVQPREGRDPRIAKTDTIGLSVGNDGVLYKMLDSRDWGKYRTISDQEAHDELMKSKEIKEQMFSMSGKMKHGRYVKQNKGTRLVAPQLGTASRTQKIQKREWEEAMRTGKSDNAALNATVSTLHANSKRPEDEDVDMNGPTLSVAPSTFKAPNGGFGVPQSPQRRAGQIDELLELKYEQNLSVVEALYNEKQHMATKIKYLEAELVQAGRGTAESIDDEIERTLSELGGGGRHQKERQVYMSESAQFEEGFSLASMLNKEGSNREEFFYGDGQAAPHFLEEEEEEQQRSARWGGRGRTSTNISSSRERDLHRMSEVRRSNSVPPRGRPQQRDMYNHQQEEEEQGGGSQSGGAATWGGASPVVRRSGLRSSSADRRSASRGSRGDSAVRASLSSTGGGGTGKVSGVSAEIQSDIDRYVAKRRAVEDMEKMKKLAEEKYEHDMKMKFQKSTANARDFTEMHRREAVSKQIAREKAKKRVQAERLKEQKEAEERRLRKEQNYLNMNLSIKNQLDWNELQELENAKRRERIEQRKQQLARMSAPPPSFVSSDGNSHKGANGGRGVGAKTGSAGKAGGEDNNGESGGCFKAEDPEKIRTRLAQQQERWDRKRAQDEKKQQERKAQTMALRQSADRGSGLLREKTAMEIRTEEFNARRQKSEEARRKAAEREEEKKKAQERAKREKLLNTKLPEPEPTLAFKRRAEQVRLEKQREEDALRKAEIERARKRKESRVAASVINSIIKEREMTRRNSHGSYIELSNNGNGRDAETIAKLKAQEARKEYNNKLKENKMKLEESLRNRPSLLERHDQKMALKAGSTAAVGKVFNAIAGTQDGQVGNKAANNTSRGSRGGESRAKARYDADDDDDEYGDDNFDLLDPKEKLILGMKL